MQIGTHLSEFAWGARSAGHLCAHKPSETQQMRDERADEERSRAAQVQPGRVTCEQVQASNGAAVPTCPSAALAVPRVQFVQREAPRAEKEPEAATEKNSNRLRTHFH